MSAPCPQKVLFVWIGRLGDLMVSTPFIVAFRARFPQARITLMVRNCSSELATAVPGVDRVITFPSLSKPGAVFRFLAHYLFSRYDCCVDLNAAYSRTSGLLCRFSGAGRRVSFKKKLHGKFYTEVIAEPEEKEHFSDRYARLAAHFGADYVPGMKLEPSRAARAEADRRAELLGIKGTNFNILVHPGNFRKTEHRWPREKFIALTGLLLEEPGNRVFYFAGPGETRPVEEMLARLPAGQVTLITAMHPAVFAALAAKFQLMIVSATGPMHIASAMGVPLLTFNSEYSWQCWRPLTGLCRNLHSGDWRTCRTISVEEAYAACQLLRKMLPEQGPQNSGPASGG
ncbi:MAG: glycosyltransferase family 9 protein [Elusimicrobiaceae bacterium]|nr:glycosyltransferase family 9 protein [Elusimicrobiaceae bacterium]